MIKKPALTAVAVAMTAALALTGCSSEPVTGTVRELEHDKAVYGWKKVGTKRKWVEKKPECYELELTNGWEGCIDKDVWSILKPGDQYDSSKY